LQVYLGSYVLQKQPGETYVLAARYAVVSGSDTVTLSDELDGEGVILGFKLAVAKLFE